MLNEDVNEYLMPPAVRSAYRSAAAEYYMWNKRYTLLDSFLIRQ